MVEILSLCKLKVFMMRMLMFWVKRILTAQRIRDRRGKEPNNVFSAPRAFSPHFHVGDAAGLPFYNTNWGHPAMQHIIRESDHQSYVASTLYIHEQLMIESDRCLLWMYRRLIMSMHRSCQVVYTSADGVFLIYPKKHGPFLKRMGNISAWTPPFLFSSPTHHYDGMLRRHEEPQTAIPWDDTA